MDEPNDHPLHNIFIRELLLSPKYFLHHDYYPIVTVKQIYTTITNVPILHNPIPKVIWNVDKSIRHFVLYKRFLIQQLIKILSEEHPAINDLLPLFLEIN